MRIFNKMKKMMLVMAASLFCANVAFADTQTVYSWESPEGTPVETGGTAVHVSGDGKRVNYSNAGYYSICLNGKYANMNDGDGEKNSDHIVLTLDEPLQVGDVISITAYRNKNADGKSSSIYFLFDNGAEWKDSNVFVNIASDENDEDYDDDGSTPNTVTWTITEAEAGSKVIKMSRNSAGTNLFIINFNITREVEVAETETEKVYATFEAPTNTNAIWNAETKSFTWTQSYYNQIRNIGLPTGDITKYKNLVIDCEIISGEQFRILFYKGSDNKVLWVKQSGVTKFDIVEELKALGEDYMDYLLNCTEICLSGAGNSGEVKINSMYLEAEVTVPASKVAYLCGATETTEAIYTALVNAGMEVTPLNYDDVTLTNEIIANDFVSKYDLVVLAGNTGSGTNLAKTANLLVGKVNVLSTKSFWYKHYGTNGGNPGTADAPSLSLVQSVIGHPIFESISATEFAVFNDMAKESGRYLQSNGQFADNNPAQTVVAKNANGTDCIGEAWVDGKGWIIIPVDGIQPAGYLTADGEALFANAAKYLIAGEQFASSTIDLTAYDKAIADAKAFQATLDASDESLAEVIAAIDEYILSAEDWLAGLKEEGEYTQENVDMIAEDLAMNVGAIQSRIEMNKLMAEVELIRAEADSIVMLYDESIRTDSAGLITALQNLPMMMMWETVESITEKLNAVKTALPLFQKENNQVIIDIAKKKANDFVATLDTSDETGTMAQLEAYNTMSYYTSDEFFAESGVSADSYEQAMSYSQQIEMMLGMYQPAIEKEKSLMAATKAAEESQKLLDSFENATDKAGLADALAKVNEILGVINMWDSEYTIEDLNAAVDAMTAASEAFKKENTLTTGTYWLKNVAANQFITAGESWGTCAMFGEHGMDFDFAIQEDGTFTIDSKLSNGGESHYFGAEGWMDAAVTKWEIVKMPGGAYSITANGTTYLGYDEANVWNGQAKVSVNLTDNTSEAAQWMIMSKEDMIATLAGATSKNPADATFFISCPNFGRNDTRFSTAWQGSPARGGANDNMNAEKWNCNFDVYQDLTGLPNGYYKLSVQGYYRAGNGGATAMDQNAYLYAGEVSTPLMSINAEAGNEVFNGGNVSDVPGLGIVPNNMATASTAFTAGLYADNSVTVQVTDGTLRIGVKKETLIEADWTIFDNFELAYLGTEEPAAVETGVYYMKNVGADKYLVAANSWGTQASFGEHGLDVQVNFLGKGKYTIDSKVSNGGDNHFLGSNGYVDSPAAEWTFVKQSNGTFALTADGTNFIGYDGSTSAMSITLTDASSANAQWQFITKEELVETLSAASMENPVDATFFIQGQNFGRNDGRNSAWQGSPAIGGDNANMNAEKWNCNFDVYQDLVGLPNGFYKVSVQGYYRAGNGGATAMDQNAYLYAGEATAPLMNINAHAGNSVFEGGNVSDVPGLGIVPNNMATASTAFSAGLYADNNVFAQVTDGTLRIGVKKDVLINADWTIFDNFELAYLGEIDPAVLAAVDSLNKLIAEAEAWQAELNPADEMHAMVLGTLEQMIPAAKAVAEAPTSADVVNMMVFDVYSMLGTYKPMVAKYDASMAATAAAEEAQALIESYEDYTDEAGLADAIASVQEGIALLNDWFEPITIEELYARVATLKVAKKSFIYENPLAPTATIVAIQAENRVVALDNEDLEGETIYYKTSESADFMIYTAPFHTSGVVSFWAYTEVTHPVTGIVYTSDVKKYEITGEVLALAAPAIETTGDAEFTCKVTSDQSAIIDEFGITPKETITYDFFPWIEAKGECAKVPSISGVLTSGEAIQNLPAGLLIVKVSAYGFESATSVEYLGAAEEWQGGDAFVTDIDEVNAKEVKEVKFYTVSGTEIEEPISGLYIKRVLFTDGTVKTSTVVGK